MTGLIRADLRSRWRSLVALGGGCFLLLLVLAGTYSAYGGSTGFAKSFGDGHSPKLFSAFSGSSSADIFEPANFLAFGFSHPMLLVLTVSVAVTSGVAAIATDVETGRAELLFTAPIARGRVLNARLVGWLIAQLLVVCMAVAGALVGSRLSHQLSAVSVVVPIRVAAQLLPLLFFLGGVSFLASSLARARGNALGIAVAVAAGSYVLNLIGLLWHPIEFARRFTPFGYFDATSAAQRYNVGAAGVLILSGLVLIGCAHWSLAHRDLA